MDVQEAVAEGTASAENGEVKRDARKQFSMGPGDILEGKLIYDGSVHADGRVEGEVRVTGNIDVASGASVKALLAGGGKVNGDVTAYNRLTVGRDASLIAGAVRIARLTVADGATFSGKVSMGKHVAEAPKPAEPVVPVVEPFVAEVPSVVVEPAPAKPVQQKSKRR